MNEREWLECDDPIGMLSYLRAAGNDRKTLLFIVACMVRIWDMIAEEGHEWVRTAERVAEGEVDRRQLEYHDDEVGESGLEHAYDVGSPVEKGVVYAVMEVFYGVWYSPANIGGTELGDAGVRPREEEKQAQARLLRDIFGNPFRPVSCDPAWQTADVLALAQAAYENRILPAGTLEAERLAVLADALEEAGCDNADILHHLRDPGVHARGCWAVDLILGRS
jgi:hypothetical protein